MTAGRGVLFWYQFVEALLISVCCNSQQLRWGHIPFSTLTCNTAVFWGGRSVFAQLHFCFCNSRFMLFGKQEWSVSSRQCVIRMPWCPLKLSLSQGVLYFPSEFLLPSISFLLAVPLSSLLWPVDLSSPPQHPASTSKHVLTFILFSLRNFSSFTDLRSCQVQDPSSQLLLTFKISFVLIAKLFAFIPSQPPLPLAVPPPCPAFLFASCRTFLCSKPSPGSHQLIFPLLLPQFLNSYSLQRSSFNLFILPVISTYSSLLLHHPLHFFLCICLVILILQTVWSRAVHRMLAMPCGLSVIGLFTQSCWMPSWWDAQGIFSLCWGWWSAGSVWPLEANNSPLVW